MKVPKGRPDKGLDKILSKKILKKSGQNSMNSDRFFNLEYIF